MGPAAPGRIPWSAVVLWIDRHRYREEEALLLQKGISAMDEAFIAWWNEDQARKRPRGT
jgi:hypothetical protein